MRSGPYHAGELAVQRRAGVEAMAGRVGHGIHATVPPAAAAFLAERPWVILATTDARGRPWASVVRGPEGFITTLTSAAGVSGIHLAARPIPGDPLAENLAVTEHLGLLAIDLATRRRMRANGRVVTHGPEGLVVRVDQVYGNCPRYIQRRLPEGPTGPAPGAVEGESRAGLRESQRDWIRGTDTFFVGTASPGEGADASHRGGAPGFVEVADNRIRWPEYPGNMMFNTLGNIESSGRAGLLVPDFMRGRALLATGRARIDWSTGDGAADTPRTVELEVEEALELAGVFPERLGPPELSPHLPPAGS